MQEISYNQLIDDANKGNGFAIAWLGVYLIDIVGDVKEGCKALVHAGDGKNVLWAKDVIHYLRSFTPWELPISDHALVSADAIEQLEIYVSDGNRWAMAILGYLLYRGTVTPQIRSKAAKLLNCSAHNGCLWAKELVAEYSLEVSVDFDTDLFKKFKNIDNSKYWLSN